MPCFVRRLQRSPRCGRTFESDTLSDGCGNAGLTMGDSEFQQPELPRPRTPTEQLLLEALRSFEGEATAGDILAVAEQKGEQAHRTFIRPNAVAYLKELDRLDFVDSEVTAKLKGTRLFRLRDDYR